ncbi:MAG TPA: hypothetical protein VM802_10250 [Chitinophaga sp.]|uniref:hypothetical protein n=1 Tax=Chitinophaga sp. TaxID=1869181 RepID=UPI002C8F4984|nr:hypothetical protein [Chitinophaga sp.]HVI45244.1 hypothetical protein [Chitinophaga sp.]
MEAKIISLVHKVTTDKEDSGSSESVVYINGAWQFAYALLWQHQQLSKFEISRSKELISQFFHKAPDKYDAFLSFCKRVAIAERYITAGILSAPPMPSIWLNPNYEHGISYTLPLLSDLKEKREKVPGYMNQIFIVAEHYCHFVLHPSTKIFRRCRRQLLSIKAYGMLQHFYNAALQSHYLRN